MDIGGSWGQLSQLPMEEFRFFDQVAVLIGFSPSGKFFLDVLANLANQGPVGFQKFYF